MRTLKVPEERDEFMAYQILLGLERHLSSRYHFAGEAPEEEDLLMRRLQRRAAAEKSRIGAALRWSLGDGGDLGERSAPAEAPPRLLLQLGEEWESFSVPEARPSPEHVVVICGPAHVEALRHRLEAALGDSKAAHRFLAQNAGLLPRLLINATWRWEPGSVQDILSMVESVPSPDAVHVQGHGQGPLGPVGPLAAMAASASNALGLSAKVPENRVPFAGPGPLFIHERLRSLSQRPLPVWPVFLVMYILTPVLAFLVIPIAIDIRWLQASASWPAFPFSEENRSDENLSGTGCQRVELERLQSCPPNLQLLRTSLISFLRIPNSGFVCRRRDGDRQAILS